MPPSSKKFISRCEDLLKAACNGFDSLDPDRHVCSGEDFPSVCREAPRHMDVEPPEGEVHVIQRSATRAPDSARPRSESPLIDVVQEGARPPLWNPHATGAIGQQGRAVRLGRGAQDAFRSR